MNKVSHFIVKKRFVGFVYFFNCFSIANIKVLGYILGALILHQFLYVLHFRMKPLAF